MQDTRYGIVGQTAPELRVTQWVDAEGRTLDDVKLADYADQFKVIYGFQSWCPGCHSQGFPVLQKMVDAFVDDDRIAFFAIQTVFEGHHANTFEKMLAVQQEYGLNIPFGHDAGDVQTGNSSRTMRDYRTGGTPWFIFIDQRGEVVFNDFHLHADKAIAWLNLNSSVDRYDALTS